MNVLLAYFIDLIVGDPAWIPHPVIHIGKAIDVLEKLLRATAAKVVGLRGAGVILTILIVGGTYLITYGVLYLLGLLWAPAATILGIWLISTTLATKSLDKAGAEIYQLLKSDNLPEGRRKVGWIVGRDTDKLTPEEVTRATIETVAENMVDAIISPLFYAFIGGAPLAMAYRAVNTLDSMVGYKNDKYLEFGWASARFDDLANYIPARLCGLLIPIASFCLGLNGIGSIKTMLRDAGKHPSPNSGYPEAGVAGAMGIRLGGLNYYGGRESFRAYMGDPLREFEPEDIRRTSRLMYLVSFLAAGTGFLLLNFWR